MDNETAGIATILVGVLIVIGAVRGTWKKLFQDVVLGQGAASSTPTSFNAPVPQSNGAAQGQTVSLQTSTYQQATAPNPYLATFG